jgi:alanine-synthesizing transaminase
MFTFARLDRLPPYVFATVNEIKMEARRAGQDIIDMGMGNPDLGTPQHILGLNGNYQIAVGHCRLV